MCGIFFAINNDSNKPFALKKFMKDAMLTSQVRGLDGFGIAVIGGKTQEEKDEPYLYKTSLSASAAYDTKGTDEAMKRVENCSLALGHVRAATEGVVSTENSHPFRIIRPDGSTLIGVHNGTLRGWKNHKDADAFKVDSHWALHMIATHGVKAFEYFTGAFAFVWWDSKTPDKVYMARNNERTLNFMVDQSDKLIVGASESGMLGWVAERNGIVVTKKKGLDALMYLKIDTLFTFDMKDVGKFTTEALPKYDYEHLYPRPANAMTPYMPMRSRYWNDGHRDVWGWPPQQRGSTYYRFDQANVLASVKKAIGDARRDLGIARIAAKADTGIVDDEELETRLFSAIEQVHEQYRINEPISVGALDVLTKPYVLLTPLNSSATRGEIKTAKKKKVYGQVVHFMPTHYESVEQALLGEFTLTVDGKRVKAMGELRHDITEAKAKNLIDSEMPVLTAVIGLSSLDLRSVVPDDDSDVYVVANLTEAQRRSAVSFVQSRLN